MPRPVRHLYFPRITLYRNIFTELNSHRVNKPEVGHALKSYPCP